MDTSEPRFIGPTPAEARATAVQRRIAEIVGGLNALHAELVRLVEEVDRDSLCGAGFRSLAHWLTWEAGMAPRTARQVVDGRRRPRQVPDSRLTRAGPRSAIAGRTRRGARPAVRRWRARGDGGAADGLRFLGPGGVTITRIDAREYAMFRPVSGPGSPEAHAYVKPTCERIDWQWVQFTPPPADSTPPEPASDPPGSP